MINLLRLFFGFRAWPEIADLLKDFSLSLLSLSSWIIGLELQGKRQGKETASLHQCGMDAIIVLSPVCLVVVRLVPFGHEIAGVAILSR